MMGYRIVFKGTAEDPEARPVKPPLATRWHVSSVMAEHDANGLGARFHENRFSFQVEHTEVGPYDVRWTDKIARKDREVRFYVPVNTRCHEAVHAYLTAMLGRDNFKICAVEFVRLSRHPSFRF